MPMPGAPPAPAGGGVGAASAPGALAGAANQGIAKVKVGLEALQAALPMLPMGGEIHSDVMQCVAKLTKHLKSQGQEGPGGGGGIQQLLEMLRNAKTQGAPNPMAAMMPGGAPGGPPPGGAGAPPPPMMPPPGAA